MFGALESLYAYREDPTHSLDEYIHLMYNKLWTFHVTYSERYELSVDQKLWIVFDSLNDSWEHERKAHTKRISDITYDNIVSELNVDYKAISGDLAGQWMHSHG